MEERLLLNRVALKSGDVAEGHFELSVLVEAHLADAALAFPNQAAMAAGIAKDAVALGLPERADRGVHVHYVGLNLIGYRRFHRGSGFEKLRNCVQMQGCIVIQAERKSQLQNW